MKALPLLAVLLVAFACGDDDGTVDDASMPDASADSATDVAADSSGDVGNDVGNQAPTAFFVATGTDVDGGGLDVELDATASMDPDGTIVSYEWALGDDSASGETVSHAFDPGCFTITLTVTDDDGATGTYSETLVATGAAVDEVAVDIDSAPVDDALLPRNLETDEGTATYIGTVGSAGPARLVARVTSGEDEVSVTTQHLCELESNDFNLEVPIPSELRAFDVEVFVERGGSSQSVAQTTNLVAGDVFVVQGQSNAASAHYSPDGGENDTEFVRTFGARNEGDPDADREWRSTADAARTMGQWPIRMASQLSQQHELPIAIINAAIGGRPISYFERNDGDPSDPTTNYGRLFRRLRNSGLIEHVRLIFWYQGESDGGAWETHRDGFIALYEDWLEDYGGFERTYVTQLRLGCGGNLNRTQEVQRNLADDYEEISVMSTTALNAHDGCHYNYEEGYRDLGDRYVALVSRDIYGVAFDEDVDAPNPMSATLADGEVIVEMRNGDSTLTYEDGAEADFLLEGSSATFSGGRVEGSRLILTVDGDASDATALHYPGRAGAGQWVTNERGIGLLSFYGLMLD